MFIVNTPPRFHFFSKFLKNIFGVIGYTRDDQPDHREWTKINASFSMKIRLDQNNPEGWNGFQALITTYMRWYVRPKHSEALLKFLKKIPCYEIS